MPCFFGDRMRLLLGIRRNIGWRALRVLRRLALRIARTPSQWSGMPFSLGDMTDLGGPAGRRLVA
eukprot:5953831-Amphidinium_carterae.1